MKKALFTLTMALTMLAPTAVTAQDNGKIQNPMIWADVPDPDVIRVGDTFYLVTTTMHLMPGAPVMASKDLKNWETVGYIFDKLTDSPKYDLQEGTVYGRGQWATSLKYHDGKFWVYFCTIDDGLMMSNATDPHGPWTPLYCVKKIPKWEDPCPFWDDDGQAYLGHSVHRAGPIIIHKMSADGKELLDTGVTVYRGPVAEGTNGDILTGTDGGGMFVIRDGSAYQIGAEGGL